VREDSGMGCRRGVAWDDDSCKTAIVGCADGVVVRLDDVRSISGIVQAMPGGTAEKLAFLVNTAARCRRVSFSWLPTLSVDEVVVPKWVDVETEGRGRVFDSRGASLSGSGGTGSRGIGAVCRHINTMK
jgi:hypothetical protein